MKDLQNQIMMEQMYYEDIYSTQTKIQRTIYLSILVHLSQLLLRNSQRIAHTSLAIDSSLVIYHILEIIRGPNLTLNH